MLSLVIPASKKPLAPVAAFFWSEFPGLGHEISTTVFARLDRKVSMRICINEETPMFTDIAPNTSRRKEPLGIRFVMAFHGADETGERQS